MKIIKGIPVSRGYAIGRVKVIEKPKLQINKTAILDHEIDTELIRFTQNVDFVVQEIENLIQEFTHSDENRKILNTHKMILQDPEFHNSINSLIQNELYSLEHAINKHFQKVVKLFKNLDNSYIALRSSDYEDVAHRLLSYVLKQRKDIYKDLTSDSILFMKSITPSEITKLFGKNIQGVCLLYGSPNSHSSIIARSMKLPMIVGLENMGAEDIENCEIIMDCFTGELIILPDNVTREKYLQKIKIEKEKSEILKQIINLESRTKDGKRVPLMCNIEIPEEIDMIVDSKSDGIGLFRTEFLFMDRTDLPDEEEQYKIYKNIAQKSGSNCVIIRTIDVGGDKIAESLGGELEANPNLGCRGIRISLQNPKFFKIQLKAIYRAALFGNIKIMFPMISSLDEILRIKKIIDICKQEMRSAKVDFKTDIPLGVMIEVPAAALCSAGIAAECDFLSIGTNDLIQYTLAVDRDNDGVAEFYNPYNPAIWQLIKLTVNNAHACNIKVAVCGELASNPIFTSLLLGLGVDELSVSPGKILEIKDIILKLDSNIIAEKSLEILKLSSADQIKSELKG